MGPHTFNFAQAAELAEAAGAAISVRNLDEGLAAAIALLGDEARLAQVSTRARGFASQHRGAAARMAEAIAELRRAGE
jgi:3-deoxy-D-manno-octulosonic-acid transferase